MVATVWKAFELEIARWLDDGRQLAFWWRDDDAGRPDPALRKLLELASGHQVPLALAVVPSIAEPSIFEGAQSDLVVMQHGVDHGNRARAGEKKSEFPAGDSIERSIARLVEGRKTLEGVAGPLAIPVLAPPWNRIAPGLVPHLAAAGYRGLSLYGVRKVTDSAPGLVTVNTHVDIIDWKGARGFCGIEAALGQALKHMEARRLGKSDPDEPIGWLTHHAVHDAGCWDFLADLFDATRGVGGVSWRSAYDLFAVGSGE